MARPAGPWSGARPAGARRRRLHGGAPGSGGLGRPRDDPRVAVRSVDTDRRRRQGSPGNGVEGSVPGLRRDWAAYGQWTAALERAGPPGNRCTATCRCMADGARRPRWRSGTPTSGPGCTASTLMKGRHPAIREWPRTTGPTSSMSAVLGCGSTGWPHWPDDARDAVGNRIPGCAVCSPICCSCGRRAWTPPCAGTAPWTSVAVRMCCLRRAGRAPASGVSSGAPAVVPYCRGRMGVSVSRSLAWVGRQPY